MLLKIWRFSLMFLGMTRKLMVFGLFASVGWFLFGSFAPKHLFISSLPVPIELSRAFLVDGDPLSHQKVILLNNVDVKVKCLSTFGVFVTVKKALFPAGTWDKSWKEHGVSLALMDNSSTVWLLRDISVSSYSSVKKVGAYEEVCDLLLSALDCRMVYVGGKIDESK